MLNGGVKVLGCVLLDVLKSPDTSVPSLTLAEWDLVVRQARSADMLSRLYVLLRAAGALSSVPSVVLRHLQWANRVTTRHQASVKYEAAVLASILSPLEVPVILLKGAAYSCAGLAPSQGRLFADIDILLPKQSLARAEALLERHGWLATHLDDYDQYYYRRWMHELPPLKHGQRLTELDVHHAILPETARAKPDTQLLLDDIVPLDPSQGLYRLGNDDVIIHSATHLFFDGEMKHGLRDLEDIDSLLRQFYTDEGCWDRLVDRAQSLDLSKPLFYALSYCSRWLGSPVPESVVVEARKRCAISSLPLRVLFLMFDRGLLPDHSSCADGFTGFSRWFLYVRSHYLKMPGHLLIPHLFYKAFITPIKARLSDNKNQQRETVETFLDEQRSAARQGR